MYIHTHTYIYIYIYIQKKCGTDGSNWIIQLLFYNEGLFFLAQNYVSTTSIFHSHLVSRGLPCVALPVLTCSPLVLTVLHPGFCQRGSSCFSLFSTSVSSMSISDSRCLAGPSLRLRPTDYHGWAAILSTSMSFSVWQNAMWCS